MSVNSERLRSMQQGIRHPIAIPAIAARGMVQYDRDSSDLRVGNRTYNGFNEITITNNSFETVAVDLDFTADKRITVLPKTEKTVSSQLFFEFNITNLDTTTTTNAGEVIVVVVIERPTMRESFYHGIPGLFGRPNQ